MSRSGDLIAVSSLFETAPVGGPEQGPFLNAVALIDTTLTARAMLDALLSIEGEIGRTRDARWGPRTLDLDILVFGSERHDEPGLSVPHPEFERRRFVLVPLLEIWPDVRLPSGVTGTTALAAVEDQDVAVFAERGWWRG